MKTTFLIFCVCIFQLSATAQQVNNDAVEYLCPPCNSQCDSLSFKNPGIYPHCSMKLITKKEIKNKIVEKKRIAFYLQEGVEVLDFAGPMEVFSYAGYEAFVVSESKEDIKSQGIMTIIPDYSIDDVPKADILAFFGGNAENASKDPEVIEWVKA